MEANTSRPAGADGEPHDRQPMRSGLPSTNLIELYRLVVSVCATEAVPERLREDVVQDAVSKIWISRARMARVRGEHDVRSLTIDPPVHAGFVRAVVRNLLTDSYRSREVVVGLEEEQPVDSGDLDRYELVDYLRSVLSALSVRDQQVLNARFLRGEGFEQLSKRFGCSPESARSLVSRALRRVRVAAREAESR